MTKIDAMIQQITTLVRYRFEELGEIESGLYNFYVKRLNENRLFPKDEMFLAHAIEKLYSVRRTVVFEPGAGLGTLGIYLAALGFRTVSIEIDPRRCSMLQLMHDLLVAKYPRAARRVEWTNLNFQVRAPGNEKVSETFS